MKPWSLHPSDIEELEDAYDYFGRPWEELSAKERFGVWAVYVRSVIVSMLGKRIGDAGQENPRLLATLNYLEYGSELPHPDDKPGRSEKVVALTHSVVLSLTPEVVVPPGAEDPHPDCYCEECLKDRTVGNPHGYAIGGEHYDIIATDPRTYENVGSYLWGRVTTEVSIQRKARGEEIVVVQASGLGTADSALPIYEALATDNAFGVPEDDEDDDCDKIEKERTPGKGNVPLQAVETLYPYEPYPFKSSTDPMHWLWQFVEQMEVLVDAGLYVDDLTAAFAAVQEKDALKKLELEELVNDIFDPGSYVNVTPIEERPLYYNSATLTRRLRDDLQAAKKAKVGFRVLMLSLGSDLPSVMQALTCGDNAGTIQGVALHRRAISEAEDAWEAIHADRETAIHSWRTVEVHGEARPVSLEAIADTIEGHDFYLLHGFCSPCRGVALNRCKRDDCDNYVQPRKQLCEDHRRIRA